MHNISKKKVAIATNMVSPYREDLFNGLVSIGYQVKVFVSVVKEVNRQWEVDIKRKRIYDIVLTKNISLKLKGKRLQEHFLHLPISLFSDLLKYKPDVIISGELGPRTVISLFYSKIYKIPLISWICVTTYTERNNSKLKTKIRKFIVNNSFAICTNLTEARQYLKEILQIPEEKIFNTPYSIDNIKWANLVKNERLNAKEFRIRNNIDNNETVFLYIGQINRRKGINELINALKFIDSKYKNKIVFLFIGGKLTRKQGEQFDNCGIKYIDVQFVQYQNLALYYAAGDIFIFPTLEDEWGIVLNEAAASSLPIISSKYAGATVDIVIENLNGFIIDPYNSIEVAKSINKILNLELAQLKRMGEKSFEICRKLDITNIISNFNEAVNHVFDFRKKKYIF